MVFSLDMVGEVIVDILLKIFAIIGVLFVSKTGIVLFVLCVLINVVCNTCSLASFGVTMLITLSILGIQIYIATK